jgi:hypothetical protein
MVGPLWYRLVMLRMLHASNSSRVGTSTMLCTPLRYRNTGRQAGSRMKEGRGAQHPIVIHACAACVVVIDQKARGLGRAGLLSLSPMLICLVRAQSS